MKFNYDIGIVGGGGHVGFPLGLIFASKKKKVVLFDTNIKVLDGIRKGKIPFKEENATSYLKKFKKNIFLSSEIKILSSCKFIIVCIGTPVDKKTLLPELKPFLKFFYDIKNLISKEQHIIIRSSVYIGSIKKIIKITNSKNITYCPERIVQGKSLVELPKLPQIVSGNSKSSINEVVNLFKKICKKIILTTIDEAELIKLFSNAFRYVNFSIANEFYMICEKLNISFKKIRIHMRDGYSRSAPLPSAGFASGPCLFKDTMQLSNYFDNSFLLGNSAIQINENMPEFIFKRIKQKINLKNKTIGVLGLAFKAETDDIRDSLSIKLIKILKKNKINFCQSDEYYENKNNISYNKLIKKSDIIVIGVMHKKYQKIKFPKDKIVINMW